MARADFRFSFPKRVRFAEVDAQATSLDEQALMLRPAARLIGR